MSRIIRKFVIVLLAAMGIGPVFGSGIPVIDVAAISNQLKQIAYMVQQLQQMQQQVAVLQAQVRAITGGRGMETLLSGQVRNYLPPEWNEAMNLLNQGNQAYRQLAD
ncbi:MAG TPA: type IV secretion system protein, partial [Gallionella sp.]|nr:type IV secretion system protein [Gallionella sp.]